MASLSGVLIVNVGWRLTYEISAYLGFAFGVIGIFLIPDIKRHRFDPAPPAKEGPKLSVCTLKFIENLALSDED